MDLRQRFLHHLAPTTFSPLALEFVRAEGVYLYDPQGKPHMDLISGIGVANLGHSHPEIVAAVQHQAAQQSSDDSSCGDSEIDEAYDIHKKARRDSFSDEDT